MNLIELILKQLLSGDMLGKLADELGAGTEDVEKAISASVPAMLSGIGSLASQPEGADQLWQTLEQVDDSMVTDFDSLLTGARTDALAQSGTSLLESLFGTSLLGSLVNGLGGFLGGKTALVTKLLPMLAPMVLGLISRQVKSGGLDLAGLVKMITSQKNNIAAAMPQGLASSLSGVQGLGDLTGFATGAAAIASATPAAAATAPNSASAARWLVPLLVVIAIVALGSWWLNRPKPTEAPKSPPSVAGKTSEGKAGGGGGSGGGGMPLDPTAAAVKLGMEYSSMFDTFTPALTGVTDATTAQAALPELQKMSDQIDVLNASLMRVPTGLQPALIRSIAKSAKAFQEQADKVLELPGVGDVLKGVLDGILSKLPAPAGEEASAGEAERPS